MIERIWYESIIINKMNTIEQVLKKHTDELMGIPGIAGTGEGVCNKKPCIKIFVTRLSEELINRIPEKLEGYPVIIEETGMFNAL